MLLAVNLKGGAALQKKLDARTKSLGKGKVIAQVGYSAPYALPLHENVAMKWQGLPRHYPWSGVYWGPAGSAKFLEKAVRMQMDMIRGIILQEYKSGKTLEQAMLSGAWWLLQRSNMNVPLRSRKLVESGYFRLKED